MSIKNNNDQNYIYQSFWFSNKIKDKYYAGNGFLSYKEDMDIEESFELAKDMAGEKEEFMPELVKKIESLIGKDNYKYDFWEFGPDCFSLYWYIKQDVYHEKMKLIQEWIRYEELEELVEFEIKVAI